MDQLEQEKNSLTAQVADLNDRLVPPLLRPYNHLDPGPCFLEAIGHIRKVVEDISLSFTTLPFILEDNGDFSIMLDRPWAASTMTVELQGGLNQKPAQMAAWLDKCRVASSSVMKSLAVQRHPGAL